jgi:hypothetical protein
MTTKAPAADLTIRVSDPWDIVTELGTSPVHALTVSESPALVVARLLEPAMISGATRDSVRCSVRHVGSRFERKKVETAANLEFFNSVEPNSASAYAVGAIMLDPAS